MTHEASDGRAVPAGSGTGPRPARGEDSPATVFRPPSGRRRPVPSVHVAIAARAGCWLTPPGAAAAATVRQAPVNPGPKPGTALPPCLSADRQCGARPCRSWGDAGQQGAGPPAALVLHGRRLAAAAGRWRMRHALAGPALLFREHRPPEVQAATSCLARMRAHLRRGTRCWGVFALENGRAGAGAVPSRSQSRDAGGGHPAGEPAGSGPRLAGPVTALTGSGAGNRAVLCGKAASGPPAGLARYRDRITNVIRWCGVRPPAGGRPRGAHRQAWRHARGGGAGHRTPLPHDARPRRHNPAARAGPTLAAACWRSSPGLAMAAGTS